ncbi:hypothetical protein LTR56_018829 [Elasticomyces elasticus]|nr:hypothetical protein LTR22_026991 [Elasticomyces elasticus]KAK3628092.1 hypothetical protein LTR56_018829 [Elasticomyces elasticus]KAK4907032.1 hypothetical protein LTR49_023885 [Elasticomyces elasticus]KAK5735038.1 hypothetical protein LTS12_026562 [Elasticomyces elasticus]
MEKVRVDIFFEADPESAEIDYYQEAWEKVRMEVGQPFARSVLADYAGLKTAYEAAFASAVKLAPDVFAYPDWSDPTEWEQS